MNRFVLGLALAVFPVAASLTFAAVTLQHEGDRNTLLVDGKPFFIEGVGGSGSKELLKAIGGNAFRTWGVDPDLQQQLDEAQKLGLKVVVGIWLEHERHGFSYSDPAFVTKQLQRAKDSIAKFKDHPAVLMWAIGNEMEGYKDGNDPRIWNAVEDIAKAAKQIDPNHPTMTVIAEIGGERVKAIHQYCPDIDVVGINSYAGSSSIPARYREQHGTKPYVITEFGPPGTWEVGKNAWEAVPEPTSTQKAASYLNAWNKGIAAEKDKLCLGGFAFTWGAKQEATATWFGMLLPDGTRVGAADLLQEAWTGSPPANRVPQINGDLKVDADTPEMGQTIKATLDVTDPESDTLTADWVLREEVEKLGTGGDVEAAPPDVAGAVLSSDPRSATVKMPDKAGRYRLFAVIHDGHGGAATANVPLFIKGEVADATDQLAPHAALPLKLYSDETDKPPYVWSGWMGKADAIALDDKSTEQPKAGKTCMKCEFKSADNFGGIVWQAPANDWGDLAGGFDLTGAKKLSFWARGAGGGEKVEFKLGIIGKEKPFFDTGTAALTVELTPEWKQYSISVVGKDLRRIKTGFVWVVGNPGKPVTFYLDDVQYE